jgi:4-hydroxythreonine-4-phosphate dehydrogenase
LKKFKPILIVAGEPNSIFLEIFFKSLKNKTYKSPLILICSLNLLKKQMKKLKYFYNINIINLKNLNNLKLNNKSINLIDVNYDFNKAFDNISNRSTKYIKDCFNVSFKLINNGFSNKLINGPISKKNFLQKKYLGITEYLCSEFSIKKNAMLIFNNQLSVCPLTTHLPLKLVTKKINKDLIYDKVFLINKFYKKIFGLKPKIAITGLNPHCESIDKFNEDDKILRPVINILKKKKYKVSGPFSADTIFLKNNRKNYDVILGMYHDQVLTPLKTLYEYDAINITLGLPFIRISPDHGPNEMMLGRNLSNPLSLIRAIEFMDKN